MTAAQELTPAPQVIGPYEIQGVLGRGGMGVVFRAVHRHKGEAVALKTTYAKKADHFACMRREIHALGQLRHPGVVRIVEQGIDGGSPWYAMELLDQARTLQDVLGDGGDLQGRLTLMYRLCRVLGHIHSRGIVHRDLKPTNVLVRDDQRPVLVDFGLVSRFGGSSREVLEISGRSVGTMAYTSPEQLDGRLVDARSDLYSFGVMLYEMLTGRLPFSSGSATRMMYQICFEPPAPPSSLVDDVPPVLEDLVMRLLEKNPRDRYGYADDVAAVLVEAGAVPDPLLPGEETPSYLYRPELEGRDTIIEVLRARLDEIAQGNGALVAVAGVSGIGKTSVATAFSREATRRKMLVITGECIPVTTAGEVGGQPLHPLRTLLHAIADHCTQHGQAEFDRILGTRIDVLKAYDESLAALAKSRGQEAVRVGEQVVRRKLLPDLAETLAEFVATQPLLLILDDLQWADEITIRFLASLKKEYFTGRRLMILALYRSDEVRPDLHELLSLPHLTKIELGRLDDGSIAAIVRSMLAANDPSEAFVQFIARQSEGSPFFVAEYLRAAVSERLLYRQSGHWRLPQGDGGTVWPNLAPAGSLIELVGYRLNGLPAETRRLGEMAAVLGRELGEALVLSAASASEPVTMQALSDLIARQILEPHGDGLRFVHDKLRETLYQKTDPELRGRLHRSAALAIEAACETPQALSAHAPELARHWEIAGDLEKAMQYLDTAGAHALSDGAGREASEYFLRLLALDERPVSRSELSAYDRRVRRARWLRLLSIARVELGDLAGALTHAKKALEIAGKPIAASAFGMKRILLLQAIEQALHLAVPRAWYRARRNRWPLLGEAANAAKIVCECAFWTELPVLMMVGGLLAVNLTERMGGGQPVGPAYGYLGLVANLLGLKSLALRYFDIGRRIAEEAGDLDGLMRLDYCSSNVYCTHTDFERARASSTNAIAIAKNLGDVHELAFGYANAAMHEYYAGEIEQAGRTYVLIRDSARKRANVQHEIWGHLGVGRNGLLTGNLDEAESALEICRRLLEVHPFHIEEVICYAHWATLHLRRGNLEQAVEAADRAYALAVASPVTLFEQFRGFSGSVEVYLEVWRRARGKDAPLEKRMRETVFAICKRLRKTASTFPLVQPYADRFEGIAHCLDGNPRRGRRLLEGAIALCRKRNQPVDEAMAAFDLLSNTDLDPVERGRYRERARTLFQNSHCGMYLQMMGDEP